MNMNRKLTHLCPEGHKEDRVPEIEEIPHSSFEEDSRENRECMWFAVSLVAVLGSHISAQPQTLQPYILLLPS